MTPFQERSEMVTDHEDILKWQICAKRGKIYQNVIICIYFLCYVLKDTNQDCPVKPGVLWAVQHRWPSWSSCIMLNLYCVHVPELWVISVPCSGQRSWYSRSPIPGWELWEGAGAFWRPEAWPPFTPPQQTVKKRKSGVNGSKSYAGYSFD